MKGQLPLDLYLPPAFGEDDFLVSASNREAMDWIRRWPAWPGPALVLVGPPGSGKTHLGTVWSARAGGIEAIEHGRCRDASEVREGSCYFVDNIDLSGSQADENLLHLYNAITQSNGHLLATSITPPTRWHDRLPDLVSRLAAAPNVPIHAPDDRLLSAVIVKMFADLQLDVGANVPAYISVRIERSLGAARDLVNEIWRASLAARRAVTLPLVREVLEERAGTRGRSARRIGNAVPDVPSGV